MPTVLLRPGCVQAWEQDPVRLLGPRTVVWGPLRGVRVWKARHCGGRRLDRRYCSATRLHLFVFAPMLTPPPPPVSLALAHMTSPSLLTATPGLSAPLSYVCVPRSIGPLGVRVCAWLEWPGLLSTNDVCVGHLPQLGPAQVLVPPRVQRNPVRRAHPGPLAGVCVCVCVRVCAYGRRPIGAHLTQPSTCVGSCN